MRRIISFPQYRHDIVELTVKIFYSGGSKIHDKLIERHGFRTHKRAVSPYA